MKKALQKVLDTFFRQFSSTAELVDRLIDSREHPQEILLLLCGRLDALASGSVREGEPGAKSFSHFITAHGRRRQLFESISIGDLYYEVNYHRWLLPGTLAKAGRLHRFSHIDDGILHLLTESDIPLTRQAATLLLTGILEALRRHFRVTPSQPTRKLATAARSEVTRIILQGLETVLSRECLTRLPNALKPLLGSRTVSRILYEKFRCGVIHGGHVLIDQEKFFGETEPYWTPLFSEHYGSFLLVEFPARFLASLLHNCIEGYRFHLIAKGKVPPDILFQVFEGEVLKYARLMDSDLLPEGGPVKFAIPHR